MMDSDHSNIEHSPLIKITECEEPKRPRSRRKLYVTILLLMTLFVSVAVGAGLYFGLKALDLGNNSGSGGGGGSKPGVYQHAAVASDSELCSKAGAGILKDNGSAVDAAIATIFCLGVVNCHSTGLGGGGFMVVHQRDNPLRPIVFDFREVAPSRASKHMYDNDSSLSINGGLAVAVPGTLKGLVAAYKKFGLNSWKSLVEPAIKIAEDGFYIHQALSSAIASTKDIILDKDNYPGMNYQFTKEDNTTLLQEGDLLKRPELAQTLKDIAKGTPDEAVELFYNSEFTDELIEEINSHGGILQKEDFVNYEVNEHDALISQFGDLQIFGAPVPASGAVFAFMLNVLEGYLPLEESGLTYHYIVEAFKFGYAHRSLLGDPRHSPNVTEVQQFLLDDDTAARARSLISDTTTYSPEHYLLFNTTGEMYYTKPGSGTSHLSVLAENGDSVAVTHTINFFFGSKILSVNNGIIFNDEMDDFSQPNRSNGFGLPEGPDNYIEPGKRPQSSTAPTVILNGSSNAVIIGASGGSIITTATLLSSINHLFFGDDISEAIELPRIHHQWLPNVLLHEANFSLEYLKYLQNLHHEIDPETRTLAVVQGITQIGPEGLIHAHCDSRKGGLPDGY